MGAKRNSEWNRDGDPVDRVLVLDIDGTLVDTNYQHALAWFRAFRRWDITVPVWRLHRAIGMGGDRLVSAVTNDEIETEYGEKLRSAWEEEFQPMLTEVVAFAGATELLLEAKNMGIKIALASSGKQEHVDHYLGLLHIGDLADKVLTSADVDATKPDPDLFASAIKALRGASAVIVGDSVWDCRAAARLDVPCIAVLSGGTGSAELLQAGAHSVYPDLLSLRGDLNQLPW